MNAVTKYMEMNKRQLNSFALSLIEVYKADYDIKYLDEDFIRKSHHDDLACELLVMETELYEKFNDERVKIRETREDLYNAKGWTK